MATVVEMVADGMRVDEILKLYPDLEPEDITEALRYVCHSDLKGIKKQK